MVQLAIDVGARYFRVLGMMPVGRAQALPAVTYSTRQTVNNMIESLAQKYAGQINVITNDIEGAGDCGSGIAFCSISATGNVMPCSFASSLVLGNVGSAPFQQIWEKSPALLRFRDAKRSRSVDPDAVSCAEGGCQASALTLLEGAN